MIYGYGYNENSELGKGNFSTITLTYFIGYFIKLILEAEIKTMNIILINICFDMQKRRLSTKITNSTRFTDLSI